MMYVRRLVLGVIGLAMCATVASAQPSITVNGTVPPNAVSTPSGSVAIVAINNGPGNTTDWIALYPIGAADTAYLDWKYLSGSTAPPSSGLTSATIQELLPVTPGDYEIRLFASDGYQLLATSSTITVSVSMTAITINGVTPPNVATVGAGTTVSLGVTNDPGNATDWVALYPAGAADSAFVDWRYLNGTVVPPASGTTSATLAFAAPITAGNFEFRLFANNGYQRLATNAFIVQASTAQLTVNGVTVPSVVNAGAGTEAVVDVAGGPANPTDWVGLFAVGSTNGQYTAWQYLNGTTSAPATGSTAASLRFLLPTTSGNYEFRLFANNTNQVLATSPTVALAASTAQITVNGIAPPDPVTAPAGSVATASISGGPANATDWVALYRAGSADSTFLDWRYLNGTTQPPSTGSSTGVVTFTVPVTAGDYEMRFFASNTYARLATSAMISAPAPTAQVAVNGTLPPDTVSVVSGSNLSVAVTGGPGNLTDWVALAPVGSATGTYVAWQYLNGLLTPPTEGLPAATVNFAAPATAGPYELRLFTNNTYERLATSTTVTVATTCTYSTDPASLTSGPAGATGTIVVTTALTCAWTATSNQGWISVSPSSSAGPGSVEYTIAANQAGARSALLTVAGQSVNVTQSGFVAPITSVVLTAPFQGTTFNAPSSLAVAATVTSNVPIASVAFYAGSVPLGSSTAAPYQTTWSSPPAGNYTIIAVATDDGGHATTSFPVNITVNGTGSDQGTLGTPIASPSPGIFGVNQPVTLTAADGTTIHYTTNGTTPTLGSPTYSGPITLTSTITIRAAAFQTGWTTSAVLVANYIIDSTPPTITATKTPLANAAGWNNGPVTVSFICKDTLAGVATCPLPLLFTSEGSGQQATVTATDLVGNQSTLTVNVKIDRTAPSLTMSSPTNGASVSTSSVTVAATAGDSLAGVSSATCNGANAAVSAGAISCTVSLIPGGNHVIVQAQDAAGNTGSLSTYVTRSATASAIMLTPAQVSLVLGSVRLLRVIDDLGQIPPTITWSSSDTTIATVDSTGSISAVGVGQATITATSASLSAQASVSVLGGPLSTGAIRWTFAPQPGFSVSRMVAVAGPIDTRFAVLENDDATGSTWILRGFDDTGVQTYTTAVPLPSVDQVDQLVGDSFGGVLIRSHRFNSNTGSLTRVGSSADDVGWRFTTKDALSDVAQGPDGSIFAGMGTSFIVLDGLTGNMKVRIEHPITHVRSIGTGSSCLNFDTGSGVASNIVVDASGAANYIVRQYAQTYSESCALQSFDTNVLAYRVDPTGDYTSTLLHGYTNQSPIYTNGDVARVLPDETGGILAYWSRRQNNGNNNFVFDDHAVYLNGGVSASEYDLPSHGIPILSAAGQIALRVVGSGTTASTVASRMVDGATLWTASGSATAALDGGGTLVTFHAGNGTVSAGILDSSGNVTATGLPASNTIGGTAPFALDGDSWVELADSRVPQALGMPVAYLDMSSGSPEDAGGPQRNSDRPTPVFEMFMPVDPISTAQTGGLVTVKQVEDAMNAQLISGLLRFIPKVVKGIEPTVGRFQADLNDPRFAAIAFFGHAVETPLSTGLGSVGLTFVDKSVVKRAQPGQDQYGDKRDEGKRQEEWNFTTAVDVLQSKVKVIFIATCEVGDTFRSLWDINAGTPDRALIAPSGGTTSMTKLNAAQETWMRMIIAMSNAGSAAQPGAGKSVYRAVNEDGNVWLNRQGFSLRFEAIGGNQGRNVRIR